MTRIVDRLSRIARSARSATGLCATLLLIASNPLPAQWVDQIPRYPLNTPWRLTTSASAFGASAGVAASVAHATRLAGLPLGFVLGTARIERSALLHGEVMTSAAWSNIRFELGFGGGSNPGGGEGILSSRLVARKGALSVRMSPTWLPGTRGVYRDTIIPGNDTIPMVARVLDVPGLPSQFFTDVEASWNSQQGRVDLHAAVGGRLGLRNEMPWWASAAVGYRVLPVAALGVQLGRSAPFARNRWSGGMTTLFVRLTPGVLRQPSVRPARESPSLSIHTSSAGTRFIMIAPGAHTVEVAGDFTNWQAIRLQRESTDAFGLLLKLDPGIYQLSVRINGGAWKAPPGLPAIADEFGSEVGVFQVR